MTGTLHRHPNHHYRLQQETIAHVLSQFEPVTGSKPANVRLPDGSVVETNTWANFSAEVVRYVKDSGHIRDIDLPVQLGKSKTYFINRTNDNGSGQRFKSSRHVDGWTMNANYNAKQHVNNCLLLLDKVGVSPSQFSIRIAP